MFGNKKNEEKYDKQYFAIYDSKTGFYWEPMLAINEHDITRQLINLLSDPKQARNQLVTNPEDFALFRVGYYDNKKGHIEATTQPEHIANVHELKRLVAQLNKPEATPEERAKELAW